MTIKERLKCKPSKLGKILRTWVAYTLLLASGLDTCLELVNLVPSEWIPVWLKTTIIIGAVVARVLGSLTVEKPKDGQV